MAESGPARSERDKLRSHRAEKPYARRPQQLRRSASIVDSIKSIVVKPLSWLTGGRVERATRESTDVSSSSSQPARLNGNYKRRASSPEETEPLQTPKKLRRLSPGGSSTAGSTTSSHLRTATSLPYLSAHSVGLRPPRASFLPPLPRTSTPSRQSSVEPTRFASPNVRASPSIGSTVFRRAGSLTPQASFDTGSDKTAFGIQYRSPFAPRASPAPASGSNGSYGGLPRQPSLLSDRGHAAFNGARSHSTVALDDDAETERGNSISPSRPTFTPLGSPVRRTSDATSVGGQLVSHLRLATLHGTESLNAFPTNRAGPTDTSGESPLVQAHRAVALIAARSASPEKSTNDRVFQALEEALPWSQSRKIRHEQRAKIRVPTPSAHPRLSGQAGRMVKPYGRESENSRGSEDVEMQDDIRTALSDEPFERLLQTRESKKVIGPLIKEDKTVKDQKSFDPAHKPVKPSTVSSDSVTPPTAPLVPAITPLTSIGAESQYDTPEPLPFALIPASTTPVSTSLPSSSSSSLRERRSRPAVHTASVSRRPNDKRPNRFAIDEEEGEGAVDVNAVDINSWASKGGLALEVPAGWSFGSKTSLSTTQTPPPIKTANHPSTSTSEATLPIDADKMSGPKSIPFPSSKPSSVSVVTPLSATPPTTAAPEPPKAVTSSSAPTASASTTTPPLFAGFGIVSSAPAVSSSPPAPPGAGTSPFGTSATKSSPFGNSDLFGSKLDPLPSSPANPVAAPTATNGPSPFGSSAAKSSPFGGTPLFGNKIVTSSVKSGGNIAPSSGSSPFGNLASTTSPFGGTSLFGSKPESSSVGAGGSTKPLPTGNGPSPFGNLATKSSPFGAAGLFGSGVAVPSSSTPQPSSSEEKKTEAISSQKPDSSSVTPPADIGAAKTPTFSSSAFTPQPALFGVTQSSGAMPSTSITPPTLSNGTIITEAKPPTPSPFAWPPPTAAPTPLNDSTTSSVEAKAPVSTANPFAFQKPSASVFGASGTTSNNKESTSLFTFGVPPASTNGAGGPGAQPGSSSNGGSKANPFTFASSTANTNSSMPFGAVSNSPSLTGGSSSTPSFLFGAAAPAQTSVSTPIEVKPRAQTPPAMTSGDGMDTSPLQSTQATLAPQNGGSAFNSFQPNASTSTFTFGTPKPTFGDSSSQFGGSRPGTPSSPFPAPSTFGAAPTSPFPGSPSLPPSTFSFGAPSVPTAAPNTHAFTFSPAASPTLSPTTLGPSAPFVFGSGSDVGSQAPGTPTTPRRPMRSLPQRKKR